MDRVVYLDNNATTQVAPEVVEEMLPYFSKLYGNPSSMYQFGGSVAKKLKEARCKVAELIGAEPEEIVFTSCGTESDNTAIWAALQSYPEKRHIITTKVEHPAVLNYCKFWENQGWQVTYLPVDELGRLDLELLKEKITSATAIVSIMTANNETGVIFPVEKIAEIVKSKGSIFHTDAVQAVGKIPIDMKHNHIDLLSFSGHKLHAPKGIGVLYIRKGVKFQPLIIGGHQEQNRRGGTENTPYIIGLGKAAELAKNYLSEENTRVKFLRDKLEQGIIERIPHIKINGDREARLPNTLNISFAYVEGEAILLLLDREGICASSGSACTSGSLEPSHVLRSMGINYNYIHGSIRFSLSRYTKEEEIDYVLDRLPVIINHLRNLSPYKAQE